ncbi:MAG TPA: hypothetical protein PLN93_04355 [Vicinamibacterales bacterium]|nr:hypothetical protein [Vicinamibacterales bacterium]HOQ60249.1 hypothetical protein [Vicinamibacterales bacterium]HPK71154.1 hypothetical protein [Vicinamibacterales bacterium]
MPFKTNAAGPLSVGASPVGGGEHADIHRTTAAKAAVAAAAFALRLLSLALVSDIPASILLV